jgi:hypothetical protein
LTFFSDIPAECWLHSGSRLGKTRKCLCLQADSSACEVFLTAVRELEQEGPAAQRKLTLTGRRHPRACSAVRLVFSRETDELKQMHMRKEGDTAVLELAPRGLNEFRRAIEDLKEGAEDFCIHPDVSQTKTRDRGQRDQESLELWFWTPYMDP